ncbi:MAG: GGDEF domain-containing protein [Clostridia bacterium]|nr:GGDEF domain-containing protein [Clostridia bacterium]
MNGYYFATVFITVATMLAVSIHLLENETLSRRVKGELKTIAIFVIAGVLCECIGTYLDGKEDGLRIAHGVVKATEFIIAPLIPMYFIKIVARKERRKTIDSVIKIVLLVNVILEVISMFVPFIFFIDENNVYNHGKYYFIYILMYFGGIGTFLFMLQKYLKKYQNRNKVTLLTLVVFMLAGFSIRLIDDSIYTDWMVVAITYLLFMIYYSDLSLKVDPLTELLNRKSYEHRLKKLDYPSAIILIDANNFKLVNDQYGHQCGDNVLKVIAKTILEVYGKYGHCYRIGGDEFCVILKQGVIEDYSALHPKANFSKVLEELGHKMDDELEAKCAEYPMLKDGVSKGFAIFSGLYDIDAKDNVNNHYTLTSVKETVKLADERMYKEKEKKKSK